MPVGNPQLDRLRARFERFISGSAPTDPFYLTNRTWKQKLRVAAIVLAPVVVLVGLLLIAVTDVFHIHKVDPYERPAGEVQAAAKVKHLPDPTLTPTDLEVVNIRIVREAHDAVVTGIVRNNTDRKVNSAEVSYYLADEQGSLVGTDAIQVADVAPHGNTTFRIALKTPAAQYVTVREVHAN